jgi:peptidoglycan/LPS O-acetylase OafA/YrhL
MDRPDLTSLPERNLDILRCIAVLSVVADHLGIALAPPSLRYTVTTLGRFGVLLFFVHTSLVLMSSLERQGQATGWVGAFYIRRVLRIYPLAIATVCLALVVHIPASIPEPGIYQPYADPSLTTIVTNLLLVQDLAGAHNIQAPFWSLPIEVQMYVFLPLCFLIARRSWKAMAILFAGFLAAYGAVSGAILPGLWRLDVFLFGPCFLAGITAYYLLRKKVSRPLPSQALFLLIGVSFSTLLIMHATDATPARNWIPCLLVGILLPTLRDANESRFTKIAKTICTYSFGIYLLHVPVMWLVFTQMPDLPLAIQLVLFTGILGLLCFGAYYVVEKPGTELGKRLARSWFRWKAGEQRAVEPPFDFGAPTAEPSERVTH